MRARWWRRALLLGSGLILSGAALAADAGIPAAGLILRGTLGSDQVQLHLRPKAGNEGVEGDYFVFGRSARVLLAGEFDEGSFWMEESANGTDVSGEWEGERKGNQFVGTWRGAEGNEQKPFILNVQNLKQAGHQSRP